MKQLLLYILTLLLLGPVEVIQAQEPAAIRFADFLDRFPKPMTTPVETMAAYVSFDMMERGIGYASKEIQGSLAILYSPLLEVLLQSADPKNKALLAGISIEEADLVASFHAGSKGLTKAGLLSWFSIWIDTHRPFVNSGKLSWTKPHASASAPVLQLHQQIKEAEGKFDWTGFKRQAEIYTPKFGTPEYESVRAVQKKFDLALKLLPKKRVKIMEGVYQEVEDPDKAIALMESQKNELRQAFEKEYGPRFRWWMSANEKLSVLSNRLDAIASQANQHQLNDADRFLQMVMVNAQARTWEAWQKLLIVTQGLFMDAMIAGVGEQQLIEQIRIYRQYKESK